MTAKGHRFEHVVAEDQVPPYEVSTVIVSGDLLYETMIFRAPAANATYGAPIVARRSATLLEAEREHGWAVEECRQKAAEETE